MAAEATLGGAVEMRGRLKFFLQSVSVLLVVCCNPQVVVGHLTVTSLPAALFQDNCGVHNVVEGSVIQLFCSVESLNVTFSWTKDGSPVVIDVPNLHERTCNDSTTTTSMLTIEDFQSSDNGTYQCMVTSRQESGIGRSTTLTALASGDTVLTFNTQPSDNEQSYEGSFFFRRDYRTGIPSGTIVDDTLLMCDVRRVGMSTSPDPTVQWIKNGELIINSTGLITSLTIDSFSQSDVGEYQCIYTDSDSDAEVLTSIPYRLQTDINTFNMISQRDESTVFLERISPEVVFLRPPEELVIEVKSTGRVIVVQWSVNGNSIPSTVLEGFANHREIYFREETTSSDIGLYEVNIFPDPIFGQLSIPIELVFIVTSPVDANTTISGGPLVAVLEGNTVTISCVSTGAPTPSIAWELNGEVAPFVPSDVVVETRTVLVRDSNANLQPDITLGSVTSDLTIVNAQYPDYNGVYTCIGSNDKQMVNNSTASITVQVQVPPEVEVTASSQHVSVGATVTLSCSVNRTNPAVDTYVWVNEAHSTILVGTERIIAVTFTLTQDFGTYRCTVNNTAGLSGSDSVTIEQGFPPTVTSIAPNLPIVVDTEVELICIVTGEDPPEMITWTFNSIVVFQGNETTGGNFTLSILSNDYGRYICTSSNEFGSNNSTIEVIRAVPPLLTPQSLDVGAVVGTPLSLTVNVTEFNLDIDSVTWTKNGSVIENGTDRYIITHISLNAPPSMVILTRDNVTSPVEDSGDYVVIIANPAGSDISTFNVTVTARPSIIVPSDDVTITLLEERDNIILNCTARGIPTPTIVWYHGDTILTGADYRTAITMPVVSSDAEGFYYVESTLTISPSDRDDSDIYYCEAENIVLGSPTTARGVFNVTVNYFVTIYEHPSSDSVVAPDMVVLTCQADGKPLPDIVWIKESADGTITEFNASTLTSTGNITIEVTINGLNKTSTLRIQPTSALDTANYSCRAQNNVGILLSRTAQVIVYVTPAISSPQNGTIILVNVTNDVTVTCTASAVPAPMIQFYYNGTLLDRTDGATGIGEGIPMRVQIGDPSSPVSISDGTYEVSRDVTLFSSREEPLTGFECRAVSGIVDMDLNLTPSDAVDFGFIVQVPPNITMGPVTRTVVSPNNVSFSCMADGVPAPDILWLLFNNNSMLVSLDEVEAPPEVLRIDSQVLEDNRTTVSSLNIFGVQPVFANNYTCRTVNQLGVDEAVAQLIVHVIPVVLEPVKNTAVTVDESRPAEFMCSAAGIPEPVISWIRVLSNGSTVELTSDGDERVMLSNPFTIENFELDNNATPVPVFGDVVQVNRTLTLSNAMDGDSGTYRCVASNEAGNDTKAFEIVVQVAPTFVVSPMDVTVTEGDDAMFTCTVTGRPRPSIMWAFIQQESCPSTLPFTIQPLNETSGDYIVERIMIGERQLEIALTVSSTRPSDTGCYVCLADNEVVGREASANALLTVEVVPMIQLDTFLPNYTVNETETVTFECTATGIPAPNITWNRNGVELSGDRVSVSNPTPASYNRSDGEVVQFVTRTLSLPNTVDGDSGTYTCNATNNAGMDSEPFELVVQIAPNITDFTPSQQTVTSPASAVFTCNATGRPRPTIQWYRVELEGGRTPLTDEDMTSGMRGISSTLTISNTHASDATNYVCVASNIVDSTEMTGSLIVYVVPMIQLDTFLTEYTVNETEIVTFECTATGIPAPIIIWNRNGVELSSDRVTVSNPTPASYNRSDGEVVQIVTRTLSLPNTVDGDSGTYTCNTINNAGMDSETFELVVQIAPNITDFAPSQQTVTSPAPAVFTCNATGRPRPTIQWYRVELEDARTPLTGEDTSSGMRGISSTLTISNTDASDATDYVCVASNIVDSTEMTGSLIVYVVPVITFAANNGVYIVNETFPVTFFCTATGIPPPTIGWSRNVDPIVDDTVSGGRFQLTNRTVNMTRGVVSVVTRMLTISNTMDTDNGTYTCEANNDAVGGKDQEDFELYVQVPPTVTRADNQTNIVASRGDTLTLTFVISRADPSVLTDGILWFYSRDFSMTPFRDTVEITGLMRPVSGNSTYSFDPDSLSLTISDIQQTLAVGEDTDGGRYFLVAINPAGINYSFYDLIINGPPVISETPSNQFVINNGSNAVFVCYARASPLHQISWTFTNASGVQSPLINTLSSDSDTTKYSINRERDNDRSFGSLTVYDVRFSDRGTYTCNVSNSIGSVSSAADLTVHVQPVIVRISNDTDAIIDNSTYLVCLATGYPIPSIMWLKNGTQISNTSFDMRIDIFGIEWSNRSEVSTYFMDNGSVEDFLNTGFNIDDVVYLRELGYVSFLRFHNVVREDTAQYSCKATNELPETTRLVNSSEPVQITVLEPPDAAVNLTVVSFGARWVNINWIIPFNGNRAVNGVYISDYSLGIIYEQILQNSSEITDASYNISQLLPFTNYTFGVVLCNEIGCSERSNMSGAITTLNDSASPPLSVQTVVSAGEVGETSITLSWTAPLMPNGVISHYQITAVGSKSYSPAFNDVRKITVSVDMSTSGDEFQTVLTGLTPGTEYLITVAAINGAGLGESSVPSESMTNNAKPIVPTGQPSTDAAVGSEARTVAVTFPQFDETNGQISHYQVAVVILPKATDISSLVSPDTEFQNINEVDYDETFCNRDFSSPFVYVTAEFARDLLPSDGQFIVGLEDQPNDRPSIYTNGLLCFSKSYTFFLRAYTFTNPTSFNQTQQRDYLTFSSTSYTQVSIILSGSNPISSLSGVIAGVLLAAVFIIVIAIIIIIVVIIVRRRSIKVYNPRLQEYETDNVYDVIDDQFKQAVYDDIDINSGFKLVEINRNAIASDATDDGFKLEDFTRNAAYEVSAALTRVVTRQPIPVTSLASHIERMHLNEDSGFSEEFKVIQERSVRHTVDACTRPDNKPRNRFSNIKCYDHSRVHLTPIEEDEHDYINGNFIPGFNSETEYIATQGPLLGTVGDFWRLVWDYNIPTVVMLTNLVEKRKVKCSQYWPNAGSQQYSSFTITLYDTTQQADFVIRHFHVKYVNSEEVRVVKQFHFTSWPIDFDVPHHPTSLLCFLRRIRHSHPYSNDKPILVHCSNGVAQTGCFIAIDVELQRARQKEEVDTFNYVLQMRDKRNHMVQTESQYTFLHDVILEGYISNDTEIMMDELDKRITELEAVDDWGISDFGKEFERLKDFKVNTNYFTDAKDEANKAKNRVVYALPYNYNRVHLKQMTPDNGDTDYINASYIDGYAQKKTYIATQGPLKNTTEDFWRMIWEEESGVIVMLTQLEEKGKEQCAQYWPQTTECPQKFGSRLSVEVLSEETHEDYICRELRITDISSSDNKSHVVKQFQFTAWPESGASSSGAGLIALIDLVTRTQQHTGNKPVIVHCSAGIGRTGVFCALSTAIERVKAEGIVDVYQTVKQLRTQRPHMVQTLDQYTFCYYAIKEHLESSDISTYA